MITILGKSNYALSIIVDIIKLNRNYAEVYVVPNIKDEENTSRDYPYEVQGLNINEIALDSFANKKFANFVLGSVGKGRQQIYQYFKKHFNIDSDEYVNIIHPSSVVSETVVCGKGIHISPLSVIAPYAVLENFVTINRNVSVGHHTILHEFACLNPGVNLAGICDIGQHVTIGAGATILDKVKIGDHSVIGAGSVVTKDIPANVVAYGVPAKVIRNV